MGDFTGRLRAAPNGPETAFDAHEKLVTIHPFSDGNGRTSRLLMNLLLLRAGYPPVAIEPGDCLPYFNALDAARAAKRAVYHAFLYTRLERALDRYLEVLRS